MSEIKTLMNLSKINGRSTYQLTAMYNAVKDSLGALKNLNVNTSSWDPIINGMVIPKWDSETQQLFEQWLKNPKEIPSVTLILEFLEWRTNTLVPSTREYTGADNRKTESRGYEYKKSFYTNSQVNGCSKCKKKGHFIWSCKDFKSLPPRERVRFVTNNGMCKLCLMQHKQGECKATYKCDICQGPHSRLLHIAEASSAYLTNMDRDDCVFPTMKVKMNGNTRIALLDQCANANFVTRDLVNKYELKLHEVNTEVSGLGKIHNKIDSGVYIELESMNSLKKEKIFALVIESITRRCPDAPFDGFNEFEKLDLANPEYNMPREVDILLGGSFYAKILQNGVRHVRGTNMIAQKSQFGWIVSGSISTKKPHTKNMKKVLISRVPQIENEENDNLARCLNRIFEEKSEIGDLTDANEHDFCESLYKETTTRTKEGRYIVQIPLKADARLGYSRKIALNYLKTMERKMDKNPGFKKLYHEFMDGYEKLGHMIQVPSIPKEREGINYIPHHAVLKEDSLTTKLRVVFNGSVATTNGISLNEAQYTGYKVQSDISQILLRFRFLKYVFATDIVKMYRQIEIPEHQWDLQRILWRPQNEEQICEYQLKTVTYGTRSAPFLATRTMIQMADENQNVRPLGSHCLRYYSYVDNIIGGSNTLSQAKDMVHELRQICTESCMPLQEWCTNTPELLNNIPRKEKIESLIDIENQTIKVLGLQWDPKPYKDCYTFKRAITDTYGQTAYTKRKVLSEIASIFDPLGLLIPLMISAKLFIRKLWASKLLWDEPLTDELHAEFLTIKGLFAFSEQISLPRYILSDQDLEQPINLHGFCDASKESYTATVYVQGKLETHLLIAKNKLSPTKKVSTIPRLELCSCVLLAELMDEVKTTLSIEFKNIDCYYWNDSKVALSWINSNKNLSVYVKNRVRTIREKTNVKDWRYVPTEENPADLGTRANKLNSAKLLANELW